MRIDVAGHGFSLDDGDEWRPIGPFRDVAIQHDHGMHLQSVHHDISIHVRGDLSLPSSLDVDGMRWLLREQNWPAPPRDETVFSGEDLSWAAATWTMSDGVAAVREYFVTNGRRIANAALMGERDRVESATPAATRLVGTILFRGADAASKPLRGTRR